MKLKLMNCLDELTEVRIPDNPQHISITVLSGDEVLEAYYLSGLVKIDISEILGTTRSIDMFCGRYTLFSKNKNINLINLLNNRIKQNEMEKFYE